jgi:MerR family copper efflux transcriptional regulator
MRIGELAKRLGVATSKIRFLEARGLIQSARLPSGYRDYDDGALQMLQIILQAQSFGFTLEEISRSLAELGSQGPSCDYLIDRLMAKLQELDHHIEQTVALRQRLLDMVEELKMRRTSGEPHWEEKKLDPPKVGARLLRAS